MTPPSVVAWFRLPLFVLAALLCPVAWQPHALAAGTELAYVPQHTAPLPPSSSYTPENANPLLQSSLDAANALHGMLMGRLSPGGPILVSSFVDLNNLAEASSMGRLISQQIASRLGQYGYSVLDARLRSNLQIVPREGEFILSRDAGKLRTLYPAEAALTGTYSHNGAAVFVSARVVRLADSVILAAYEYTLPLSALDRSYGDTWNQYAARRQLFPGSPTGAPGARGWTDPAGLALQKPLPTAKR